MAKSRVQFAVTTALTAALITSSAFGTTASSSASLPESRADVVEISKLPPGFLRSAGIPADANLEDPKWKKEVVALVKQTNDVYRFLPPDDVLKADTKRESVLTEIYRRRTNVTFFLFAQLLAEMVEDGKNESESWWSQTQHRYLGAVNPEVQWRKRRDCAALMIDQWGARANSGQFSSTRHLISQWMLGFHGTKECRDFANQIVGREAANSVHGQFLELLMRAEANFRIYDQKLAHLEATRILLATSSQQFPRTAFQVAAFYMEDRDAKIVDIAKRQLALVERHAMVRRFMNWISPDTIATAVAGGGAVIRGLGYLSAISSTVAQNTKRAVALTATLTLHLGLATQVSAKAKDAATTAMAIRTTRGKNQPIANADDEQNLDVAAVDTQAMTYDLLSRELLSEWAMNARRGHFNHGQTPNDLGHFIIQNELQSARGSVLAHYQNLHLLIDRASSAILVELARPEGNFLSKMNKARKRASDLFLLTDYQKYKTYLTPFLSGSGGNCITSALFFSAAFWAARDRLPKEWEIAIEIQPMHIQAVLANKGEGVAFDLESGVAGPGLKYGLYSPLVLIEGYFRAQKRTDKSVETRRWSSYIEALPSDQSMLRAAAASVARLMLGLEAKSQYLNQDRFIVLPPPLVSEDEGQELGYEGRAKDLSDVPVTARRQVSDFRFEKKGNSGPRDPRTAEKGQAAEKKSGEKEKPAEADVAADQSASREATAREFAQILDEAKRLQGELQKRDRVVPEFLRRRDQPRDGSGERVRFTAEMLKQLREAGIRLDQFEGYGQGYGQGYGFGYVHDVSDDQLAAREVNPREHKKIFVSERDWKKPVEEWSRRSEPPFSMTGSSITFIGKNRARYDYYTLNIKSDQLRDRVESAPDDEARAELLIEPFRAQLRLQIKNTQELLAYLRNPTKRFLSAAAFDVFGVAPDRPFAYSDETMLDVILGMKGQWTHVRFPTLIDTQDELEAFQMYEQAAFEFAEIRELWRLEAEIAYMIGKNPDLFLRLVTNTSIEEETRKYLKALVYQISNHRLSTYKKSSDQIRQEPAADLAQLKTSQLTRWLQIKQAVVARVAMAAADPKILGITEKIDKTEPESAVVPLPLPPQKEAAAADRLQLVDVTPKKKPVSQCRGPEPTGKCQEQEIVYVNAGPALVYATPEDYLDILQNLRLGLAGHDSKMFEANRIASPKVAERLAQSDVDDLIVQAVMTASRNNLKTAADPSITTAAELRDRVRRQNHFSPSPWLIAMVIKFTEPHRNSAVEIAMTEHSAMAFTENGQTKTELKIEKTSIKTSRKLAKLWSCLAPIEKRNLESAMQRVAKQNAGEKTVEDPAIMKLKGAAFRQFLKTELAPERQALECLERI